MQLRQAANGAGALRISNSGAAQASRSAALAEAAAARAEESAAAAKAAAEAIGKDGGIFIARYGATSYDEIQAALDAGKVAFVQNGSYSLSGSLYLFSGGSMGIDGAGRYNAFSFIAQTRSEVYVATCRKYRASGNTEWSETGVPRGTYVMPASGIPKKDLAADVQASLDSASGVKTAVVNALRQLQAAFEDGGNAGAAAIIGSLILDLAALA